MVKVSLVALDVHEHAHKGEPLRQITVSLGVQVLEPCRFTSEHGIFHGLGMRCGLGRTPTNF